MKKRCKNCVHRSWTIEGDAYCDKNIRYTNDDGCCSEFKPVFKMSLSSIIALSIAIVALILSLTRLLAHG